MSNMHDGYQAVCESIARGQISWPLGEQHTVEVSIEGAYNFLDSTRRVTLHTGADATARLVAYIDTPTSGLPFTPAAGQTVNITWDNGANKIFKL